MALTRRTLLLAKIETTPGVDAVPVVSTDSIPITSFSITPNVALLDRNVFRDTLSPAIPIAGKRYMTVTFSVDIVGNGIQQDGATAPFLVRLLESSGMISTPTAETAALAGDGYFTITPTSTLFQYITIYAYLDGIVYKILGCQGTPKITLDANALGKVDFTFTGIFSSPTDVTMPTSPSLSTVVPPLIKSINLTMGTSFVPVLSSFDVDLANNINQRDDMNANTGIGSIEISGRKPTGSLNPDLMTAATYDVWGNFLNSTPQQITGQVGATAGNIMEVTIPSAIYNSIGIGDRDGIRSYDIKYTPTGKDNEVSIVLK